jgi:type IV pilus assembly protein PilN
MIRINLLPYREMQREAKKREFNFILGFTAFAAAGLVLLGSTYINNSIDNQLARNQRLDTEIANLDQEIADIKNLQTQIRLMLDRKKVVENLQTNRNQSVVILDELSRQLPSGMYFKSIKQQGKKITLKGIADNNARVATMVRNLNGSNWLSTPTLVEIKSEIQAKEKVNAFTLNVNIKDQNIEFGENIAHQVPTR